MSVTKPEPKQPFPSLFSDLVVGKDKDRVRKPDLPNLPIQSILPRPTDPQDFKEGLLGGQGTRKVDEARVSLPSAALPEAPVPAAPLPGRVAPAVLAPLAPVPKDNSALIPKSEDDSNLPSRRTENVAIYRFFKERVLPKESPGLGMGDCISLAWRQCDGISSTLSLLSSALALVLDKQSYISNSIKSFETTLTDQINKNMQKWEERIQDALPDPQFLELNRLIRSILNKSISDLLHTEINNYLNKNKYNIQISSRMVQDVTHSLLMSIFINLAETLNANAVKIPNYNKQNSLTNLILLFNQEIASIIPTKEDFDQIEHAAFESKRLYDSLKSIMEDNDSAHKSIRALISPDGQGIYLEGPQKDVLLAKVFRDYNHLNADKKQAIDQMIGFGREQNELVGIFSKITDKLLVLFFPKKFDSVYIKGLDSSLFKDKEFQDKILDIIKFHLNDFLINNYLPLAANPARNTEWVKTITDRMGNQNIESLTQAPTTILFQLAKGFVQTNPKALDLITWGLHFVAESTKDSQAVPASNAAPIPHAVQPVQPKINSVAELNYQPLANWILESIRTLLVSDDPMLDRSAHYIKGLFGDITLGLFAQGTALAIPSNVKVDPKHVMKHIIDLIIEKTKLLGKGQEPPSKEFWENFLHDLPVPPLALPLVATRLAERAGQLKDVYIKFLETNAKIEEFYQSSLKQIQNYPNKLHLIDLTEKLAQKLAEEIFARLNGLNSIDTNWVESRLETYLSKYLPGFHLDPNLKAWFKDNLNTLGADLKGISPDSEIVKKGIQSILLRGCHYLIENNTNHKEPEQWGSQIVQSIYSLFKDSFSSLTGAGKDVRLKELKEGFTLLALIREESHAKAQVQKDQKKNQLDLENCQTVTPAELKMILDVMHLQNKQEEAEKNAAEMEDNFKRYLAKFNWKPTDLKQIREAISYYENKKNSVPLEGFDEHILQLKNRLKGIENLLKQTEDIKLSESKKEHEIELSYYLTLKTLLQLPTEDFEMVKECLNIEFTLPQTKLKAAQIKAAFDQAKGILLVEKGKANVKKEFIDAVHLYDTIEDQKKKLIQHTVEIEKLEKELEGKIQPFQELSNQVFNLIGLGNKNKFIPEFIWERAHAILSDVRNSHTPRLLFEQMYPVLIPILQKEESQIELFRITGNDVLSRLASAITKEMLGKSPNMLAGVPDAILDKIEQMLPGSAQQLQALVGPQLKAVLSSGEALNGSKEILESYIEGILLLCFIQAAQKKQGAVDQKVFLKGLITELFNMVKAIGSKQAPVDKLWNSVIHELPIPQFVKDKMLEYLVAQSSHIQELFENVLKIEHFHEAVCSEVKGYKNGELLISAADKISKRVVDKVMEKLQSGDVIDIDFLERNFENMLNQFLPDLEINGNFKIWIRENLDLVATDLASISAESSNLFKRGLEAAILKSFIHLIKSIDKDDIDQQSAPLFASLYKAFKGAFIDLGKHKKDLEDCLKIKTVLENTQKEKEVLVKEVTDLIQGLAGDVVLSQPEKQALRDAELIIEKRFRARKNKIELEVDLKAKLDQLNKGLANPPWDLEAIKRVHALLLDPNIKQIWEASPSYLGVYAKEKVVLLRESFRLVKALDQAVLETVAAIVDPKPASPEILARLNALHAKKLELWAIENKIVALEEVEDTKLKFFQELSEKFVGLLDLKELPEVIRHPIVGTLEPLHKKYIPRVLFDQFYPMLDPILHLEDNQQRIRQLTGNEFFVKLSNLISNDLINKAPEVLDNFPMEITQAIESLLPGDAGRFQALIIPQLRLILSQFNDPNGGRAIVQKYVEGVLLKVFVHTIEKKQTARDSKTFMKEVFEQSTAAAKALSRGEKTFDAFSQEFIKGLPIPPFVQDLLISSLGSKSESIKELFQAITKFEDFHEQSVEDVANYKNGPLVLAITDKIANLAVTEVLKVVKTSKFLDVNILEGTLRELFDKYLPGLEIDATFKTWLKDNNEFFEKELKQISDDPALYKKVIQSVILRAIGKIILNLQKEDLEKQAAPIFHLFYVKFKEFFTDFKGNKEGLERAATEHKKLSVLLEETEILVKKTEELKKQLAIHSGILNLLDQLSSARKYRSGLQNRLDTEPANRVYLQRYIRQTSEKVDKLEKEFQDKIKDLPVVSAFDNLDKLDKELIRKRAEQLDSERSFDGCLDFFQGFSKKLTDFIGLTDASVFPELIREGVWPHIATAQKQLSRQLFGQIYPIALPILRRESYKEKLKVLTGSDFLLQIAQTISTDVVAKAPKLLDGVEDALIKSLDVYIPGEASKLHALIKPQLMAIVSLPDGQEGGKALIQEYVEGMILKAFIQIVEKNRAPRLENVLDTVAAKVKQVLASENIAALLKKKTAENENEIQAQIANEVAKDVAATILGFESSEDIIGLPVELKTTVLEELRKQLKQHLSPFLLVLQDKAKDQNTLRELSPYLANLCQATSKHLITFVVPTFVKTYQTVAEKMITELSERKLSEEERNKLIRNLTKRIEQIAKDANPTDTRVNPIVVKNKNLLNAFRLACKEENMDICQDQSADLLRKIKAIHVKYDLQAILFTPDSIVESLVKGFPGITAEVRAELTQALNRIAGMGVDGKSEAFATLSQEYLEVILQKIFIDVARGIQDKEGKKDVSLVLIDRLLKLLSEKYTEIRAEFANFEGQENKDQLKREAVERTANALTASLIKDVFGIDPSKMDSMKELPSEIRTVIFDLFKNQVHTQIKNLLVSFSEQLKTLESTQEGVKKSYADLNKLLEITFAEEAIRNVAQSSVDATLSMMNEVIEQEGGVKLKKGTLLGVEGTTSYLEGLLRAHMPIAGYLLDYSQGLELAHLLDSSIPGNGKEDALAKLGAASMVANFIIQPLQASIEKLVQLERTKGVEFNTKLGVNLLKATAKHFEIVNAAKKMAGSGDMVHAHFALAAQEKNHLHEALPVDKPTFENSIQLIEKLISVQLDKAKTLPVFEELAEKDKLKKQPLSTLHIMTALEKIVGHNLSEDQRMKLEKANKGGVIKELIRREAEENSHRRVEKLYQPLMKKLLKVCFPNGQNDLTFLPKEIRGPVWRQFKSQGHILFSTMIENLLDPDNITTMVLSSLENMRDNLRGEVELDFSKPRTNVTELDEACGELMLQVLDLTKLPSWMVKMVKDPKTGKISNAMKIQLGSLMMKQLDGKFIQKNLKLAFEKIVAKDAKGGSIVDYDSRHPAVKEAEKPALRKQQEAKLDKVVLECVDATIKYQIKSYVKHKLASLDSSIEKIFGKNKVVKAGVKTLLGILTSFIWIIPGTVLFFSYYLPTTKHIAAWWISLEKNKKALMDVLRKAPLQQPEKVKHVIFNEQWMFDMMEGFVNATAS